MLKNIKKYLFIILGSVSVILGVIGFFLPLIPTTPFILFAAYCYLRSSKKLYNKLINNKYLGIYIKNYMENKGIPLKFKIYSISLLWISIIISSIIINKNLVSFILIFIAIFVTLHIIKIKTYKD